MAPWKVCLDLPLCGGSRGGASARKPRFLPDHVPWKNGVAYQDPSFCWDPGNLTYVKKVGWTIANIPCVIHSLWGTSLWYLNTCSLQEQLERNLCVMVSFNVVQPQKVSFDVFPDSVYWMLLWSCSWWSCWTKIYRTAFWMLNYGHPNDKRTKLWSTSYYVALFNQGKKDLTKKDKNAPPTTERYLDRAGRVRFKGTKALKSSQILVGLWLWLTFCWRCFRNHLKFGSFLVFVPRCPLMNPRVYPPSFCGFMLRARKTLLKSKPALPKAHSLHECAGNVWGRGSVGKRIPQKISFHNLSWDIVGSKLHRLLPKDTAGC